MASIQPYKISVPDSKIQRLKDKLAVYDLPDEVPDVEPWTRGPPLADIKRLADHWANTFDWRKAEAKLNNALPQFMTKVDVDDFGTHDIHFIHQQSSVKNAIPLLFVHGWPGSFIEVVKILPLLVEGGKDYPAFHVVAPSLVNFGFSSTGSKVHTIGEDH
jgi:pimeloyl-ACP methyl ester carboxylesterase